METLKSFSTRGGKYQIKLVKDNYGYCIKSYKNNDCNSTDNLGNCSLAKALLEIDTVVKNAKYFDNINYIQDANI